MPQFAYPYQPQTPIGQALQNIAIAMMAGAQGKNNQAHDALYAGQASKAQAEADMLRQQLMDRRGATGQIAASVFGGEDNGRTYLDHWRGANLPAAPWGTAQVSGDAETGEGGMTAINAKPDWVTPDREKRFADTMTGLALGNAGKASTADQIAKAVTETGESRIRDDMIAGRQPVMPVAQAMYAMKGAAPFHFSDQGVGNQITGAYQPTQYGVAKTAEAGASAQKNLAGVGAQAALAEERRASAGAHQARGASYATRPGKLVVTLDENGTPRWTPESDAAGEPAGRPPSQGGAQPKIADLAKQAKGVAELSPIVQNYLRDSVPAGAKIESGAATAIASRAGAYITQGMDADAAIRQAMKDVPLERKSEPGLLWGEQNVRYGARDVAQSVTGGAQPAQQRQTTPAPLRNNNPGAMMPGGKLARYGSIEEGIAAMDRNLQRYGASGVNTLAGVISKWAPPNENDTNAYIAGASKRLGIRPNQPIDLSNAAQRHAIATAIMLHENGVNGVFSGSSGVARPAAPPQGQPRRLVFDPATGGFR